jgi:lipopolysaccharide export system ATP-binding protein
MGTFVADSVACRFGESFALSDVCLELRTGEITGLVGRNGSGKTTLLRLVLGHSGHGEAVVKADGTFVPASRRWRHVAYLPQQSFLPRDCSVRRAGRLFVGAGSDAVLQSDSRAATLFQRKVGDLSSGERRYVEFLLVLALDRPFAFLDEPFSQIEPLYVELMSRALRDRKDRGFLITDHNYWAVREVSTRLLSLSDGRLRQIGPTDEELRRAGYLP